MFQRPVIWLLILLFAILGLATWQLNKENIQINLVDNYQSDLSQTDLFNITKTTSKAPDKVLVFPDDPIQGQRSNMLVTIIEFSDFECPYCLQVAPILKNIVEQSSNTIKLVWKDFPLPGHNQALAAAEAAQCAARQGKFWEYHNELFKNQSNLGSELYTKIATDLGIAGTSFSNCLSKHETKPLINRNIEEADSVGVDGTPYLIINGQVYNGAISAEEINNFIKQVTKQS